MKLKDRSLTHSSYGFKKPSGADNAPDITLTASCSGIDLSMYDGWNGCALELTPKEARELAVDLTHLSGVASAIEEQEDEDDG